MTKDERIAELEREVLDWKDGTMICNYEKQLAEKDKEITTLKKSIEFLSSDKVVSEEQCKQIAREAQIKVFKENIMLINRTIRHEICKKIREKLKKCITPACGSYIVYYEAKNVEDVLDKIESEK